MILKPYLGVFQKISYEIFEFLNASTKKNFTSKRRYLQWTLPDQILFEPSDVSILLARLSAQIALNSLKFLEKLEFSFQNFSFEHEKDEKIKSFISTAL